MLRLAQQVAMSHGISHGAVRKLLKLHPYRITAVQELKPVDDQKWVHYCHWFNPFINTHADTLDITYFLDKI
jgi:hypothetical protein